MAQPTDTTKREYAFFHASNKTLVRENQYIFESAYSSAHVTFVNQILANEIPHMPNQTDVDVFIASNPGILKKYDHHPLTEVGGSNGQTWYIDDGNVWMKPIIMASMIPHPTTNAQSDGFIVRLYRDTGQPISPTSGAWWVDPFQGVIKCQSGYTPADLGWGIPTITCYTYIGQTLSDYINNILPVTYKYRSGFPMVTHNINHNMNSYDVMINVLTEDPVSQKWYRDLVNVEYTDENNMTVFLTESCNVNVMIWQVPG